jgi:RHS repeat-associated protein
VLAGDLTNNTYAFTGQRLDPESNLYHFHFRQYDAEVGVWTTRDPAGVLGGVNVYEYVFGNPINNIDFLGLKCDLGQNPTLSESLLSFLDDVAENFQTTNEVIGIKRSALTLGFGGSFAKNYGGYTLGQYVLGGPAKHLGSHRATLSLVTRTSVVNSVLITGAFEAGVLAGSIITVAVERAYDNYVETRTNLEVDRKLREFFDELDDTEDRQSGNDNSPSSGNSDFGDRTSSPGGLGGV